MERITVNFSGKVRTETLGGKTFRVARAVMIVPGVLAGSSGALLYTANETKKNYHAWNGMPLTLGHPQIDGKYVSARHPKVLERYQVGQVFGANVDDKLTAEAWFDVDRLKATAQGRVVLNKLDSGQPIEISTGLFTTNRPAPKGSHWFGRPYDYVATDYRPDHLAVLLDQRGACSNEDGCGVNVNQRTDPEDDSVETDSDTAIHEDADPADVTGNAGANQPKSLNTGKFKKYGSGTGKGECHEAAQAGAYGPKPTEQNAEHECGCKDKTKCECGNELKKPVTNRQETVVKKTDAIAYLTANCACWKGEEKTLEQFTDNKLVELVEADKRAKADAVVANAVTEAFGDEVSELTANEMPAFLKKKIAAKSAAPDDEEDDEEEEEEPAMNKKKPTANEVVKPKTVDQWLSEAPQPIRTAVQNAMAIERREKEMIVNQLVSDVTDEAKRQRLTKNFLAKDLAELTDYLALKGEPKASEDETTVANGRFIPSYLGAAGAVPTANRQTYDKDDFLPLPTINYAELAKAQR